MAKLYTADIKKMSIKKVQLNTDCLETIFNETTLIKDSLFYINRFNRPINFNFSNYLPDRYEAYDILSNNFSETAIFVDYSELNYLAYVDEEDFKRLQLNYKNKRR